MSLCIENIVPTKIYHLCNSNVVGFGFCCVFYLHFFPIEKCLSQLSQHANLWVKEKEI